MKASLILENGMVFEGEAFGHIETCVGEVVFNTGMTGYQEVLTDPSYYGQIVTMTYPLVGNYGIILEDDESSSAKVRGFIVRERCEASSNFRSEIELDKYLKQQKVMGISGVDTLALTRLIRNFGTMKGIITVEVLSERSRKAYFDSFDNRDAVLNVTTKDVSVIAASKDENRALRISLMDFGAKRNIIRNLKSRGCEITVYPAMTSAETLLDDGSDLIFLSNGPGDPEDLTSIIGEVKKMVGKKPIAGICLGHQIIALAMGGKTAKLKFGHRGCNHPVKDLAKNKVYITSQNHGYHVSQMPTDFEVTHISMNDQSIEGMRHRNLPVFSVQFHPEASPGPVESGYLFDEFLALAK